MGARSGRVRANVRGIALLSGDAAEVTADSANMFLRILHLTPGYIRYLQTEAAYASLRKEGGAVLPRVAALLGMTGIGVSGYSSRQLTLHYKPSSRIL